MNFAVEIYAVANSLPKSEQFGLSSQIKRSVVSVPANIAEGAARKGTKELIQFLYISLGSLSELETHLELCVRLKYIDHIDMQMNNLIIIRKKIITLIRALETKMVNG